jgi:RNA-directed DNA polymerase
VLDRFIQQAVMQVLQKQVGPDVFRSQLRVSARALGASGGGAAQQYIAAGYRWVVDLDLEKFFDRVSHDKLMARSQNGSATSGC